MIGLATKYAILENYCPFAAYCSGHFHPICPAKSCLVDVTEHATHSWKNLARHCELARAKTQVVQHLHLPVLPMPS
jgi:hypothetical protein